ncbi:hypothetical protein [Streptomyces uncialis]|uniref:Protein spdB n=1 Tax=Streptomyces uncialis TaxID=1048205 RepID=A0A1Q4V153_9ACTN|nr:hypothetical protein [Streptomyces uncialis]OKH91479.1 hypothetical protein AB852_28385 [Streptomyces uncialis]
MTTRISALAYPAAALSLASLAWTTWSLVDLLGTGPIGLTVAAGADIIWASVILAEARGLHIAGRRWAVPAVGWAALLVVAALLAWHGLDRDSAAMAIAGPFLPLGAKGIWALALADMRDPAALTPEQEAEIHGVMRHAEYAARIAAAERALLDRRTDAAIDHIRAEARALLARDEADFEIRLERLGKEADLARRTPLAISAPPERVRESAGFEQAATEAINAIGEHEHGAREHPANTPNTNAPSPNRIREQIANKATTSTNTDREQPSVITLVREHVARTANNTDAVRAVMAARPDANKDSVAAAVRRERRRTDSRDGYA